MATSINQDNNKLHYSVVSGQLNLVQRLISNGCDPNSPHTTTGLRPIHFAASRGHVKLVQFLAQLNNVDIDAMDKEGETALLKAAYAGHLPVIEYLVQSNANPVHKDRDGWTALHNACSCGNVDIVRFLLNQPNVNVNVTSEQGHTPLMNAASKGYTEIVLLLLNEEYNANPLVKNRFGETAYDVAAAAGEAYLCQLIEGFEYKWNSQDFNTLNMHVTIPVLLVEEQDTKTRDTTWYFNGKLVMNKSRVRLPNACWFWLSDWSIDYTNPNIEYDGEGWSHLTRKKTRQWKRIMKKSMDLATQIDTSSSETEEEEDTADENVTLVNTTAIFIGCASHTRPVLQEQMSKELLLWEDNDQVPDCRRCHRWFNFIVRRHHCRKCGQIICDKCSSQRVYLPPHHIIQSPNIPFQDTHTLSLHPQRICDQCVYDVHNSKKRTSSVMMECPVCTKKLTEYKTASEQEQHVQACFNKGASTNIGIRFVVYKLSETSTLIGQECVICFEEFQSDDTITRLDCMCSYHSHCINSWFSKGKECPIHSQ